MPFSAVENAVDAVGRGEFVVVVDGEPGSGGVLTVAAEKITPEKMAFLIRHTSGVVNLALEPARLDALRLATDASVDALHTTAGISPADRCTTVLALIDAQTRAADLTRPGHIFPVRAREHGVLQRAGHAEAALDLARLAGWIPAGVLADLVDDDGTMLGEADLRRFADRHGFALLAVADLIRVRSHREKLVRRVSAARIPTKYGDFTAHVYASLLDGTEHLAFVRGEVAGKQGLLVRVHSECLTGDVFGSMRCDCGTQLDLAMARVAEAGEGVVVYLRGHEGRGIGLGHKLAAYSLQDAGRDTVEANLDLGFPADLREYGVAAQILVDLGVTTMRLMTNNPAKYGGIDGFGLEIVERVPLATVPNDENIAYLRAKQEKLGHLLGIAAEEQ